MNSLLKIFWNGMWWSIIFSVELTRIFGILFFIIGVIILNIREPSFEAFFGGIIWLAIALPIINFIFKFFRELFKTALFDSYK